MSNFLTLGSHEGLVLADLKLLAVDDARSLRAWLVLVVRILLQMSFAKSGLFLVVGLLLSIGHSLPLGTYKEILKDKGDFWS